MEARSEDEQQRSAGRWVDVLESMERLAGATDDQQVLTVLWECLRRCAPCQGVRLMRYEPATNILLVARSDPPSGTAALGADEGLSGVAIRDRRLIALAPDHEWGAVPRDLAAWVNPSGRSVFVAPLVSHEGGPEGVAQIVSAPGRMLTGEHAAMVRAITSQGAIALRRTRKREAERRRDRLRSELDAARSVQRAALPGQTPTVPGYEIAAATIAAEETGGDAFDLIPLADGDDAELLLFLADASGHGLGPALTVLQTQAMLRMAVRLGTSIPDTVREINALLAERATFGRFVTAFVGRLDPNAHSVSYVSAGQGPILIVRADGTPEFRGADAVPLGILPDTVPAGSEPLALNPGDVLVVLSDGYYELSSRAGARFGRSRVVDVISSARARSARDMLVGLEVAATRFAGGERPDDDRTAIIVKRL